MAKAYPVLRIARLVLLVLAYFFGLSTLIFAGLIPLFAGGEPVPLLPDGTAISARLFGLLAILISAPVGFLFFYVPSGIIRVLLEVRERLVASPSSGAGPSR